VLLHYKHVLLREITMVFRLSDLGEFRHMMEVEDMIAREANGQAAVLPKVRPRLREESPDAPIASVGAPGFRLSDLGEFSLMMRTEDAIAREASRQAAVVPKAARTSRSRKKSPEDPVASVAPAPDTPEFD
jgi:hypothetical protein